MIQMSRGNQDRDTVECELGVNPYSGAVNKPDPNIDWDREDSNQRATRNYRASKGFCALGSKSTKPPKR